MQLQLKEIQWQIELTKIRDPILCSSFACWHSFLLLLLLLTPTLSRRWDLLGCLYDKIVSVWRRVHRQVELRAKCKMIRHSKLKKSITTTSWNWGLEHSFFLDRRWCFYYFCCVFKTLNCKNPNLLFSLFPSNDFQQKICAFLLNKPFVLMDTLNILLFFSLVSLCAMATAKVWCFLIIYVNKASFMCT